MDFTGSLLKFMKVLNKLKDFTLPSGDVMLDKWRANNKVANQHLQAGDYSALQKVAHETVSVLRALLPSIPDKIVYAAVESLPKIYENGLEKAMIAGTATLPQMNEFIRLASRILLEAMSKTKPTAETLN